MFIKITSSGKYEYAQIVESYRDELGKTKHRTLFNLGRLDNIKDNKSFQNLAHKLLRLSNAKDFVNLASASEAKTVNWGYIVYQKIWKEFGLNKLLPQLTANTKVSYDINAACLLMAIQHLLQPASKLKTSENQDKYFNLAPVELNHLYRALDILAENKEILEDQLFEKNRTLYNLKVDVLFYDVTTFHFESVIADSLKDFGYSKDGKFKEVQVVLGLLVDCEGRPVGYDLFPGDTYEGHTLERALAKIKNRFGIRRVIIVADRGLNSKMNLKTLKDSGYDYIVASRIRGMKKTVKNEIFNPEGYQKITTSNEDEKEGTLFKIIEYVNTFKDEDGNKHDLEENLIITYSEKRARKDKQDRERLIEKAKKLLKDKEQIKASNKRGGKKFLKEINSKVFEWQLDEEAILKDEVYDGYYGIQTSKKDHKPEKVLEAYRTLWKIEESFRIMKSTLEVRPVFHWTKKRIEGHFVLCFLTFLLERTLEFKLKKNDIEASPERIRESLNSLNFSEFEVDGEVYYLKEKGTDLARKILRMMRIGSPKNITKKDELSIN